MIKSLAKSRVVLVIEKLESQLHFVDSVKEMNTDQVKLFIADAKELPKADVTRMEFDMKDQMIRQTIITTQEDVTEIKEDIKRIEVKIDQLR